MTPIAELLKWWQEDYQLNYANRTPQTNDKILATLHYLKSYSLLMGVQS